MSDYSKLVEALETGYGALWNQSGPHIDKVRSLLSSALPLARQLIEEWKDMVPYQDLAAAEAESDQLREENERLSEFSKTKGGVVEAGQRIIADLQARLSAAEEQADRDGTERYVMNEQLWAKQKQLERAEEVIEAAKNARVIGFGPGIAKVDSGSWSAIVERIRQYGESYPREDGE